eukprot:GFKZ01006347.1.p1 GENE.GFKZ01006347.1~~GFKZ01006347.1.p1  ORF type:complete len:104 (+),score=1.74 GFKZ01006347.1:207-518(+)
MLADGVGGLLDEHVEGFCRVSATRPFDLRMRNNFVAWAATHLGDNLGVTELDFNLRCHLAPIHHLAYPCPLPHAQNSFARWSALMHSWSSFCKVRVVALECAG